MPEPIKSRLKKVVRAIADWPVAGRFVRIAVALYRLPESHARQQDFFREQVPALLCMLAEMDQRQRDAADAYQAREAIRAADDERRFHELNNLALSLPVTLRKMAREMADTRALLNRSAPRDSGESVYRDADRVFLDQEKLAAARSAGVRLNLGCGHIALEGYLNVDRRALPGVDIVCGVDALPFEDGEVDEVYSAHLLEHFPQEQLVRDILPYWIGLLKPGGTFRAVVPDAEAMIRRYADNDYPYPDLREVMFGSQDYDGNFHFNMFTPDSLCRILRDAGLIGVEVVDRARRNGKCFEFEIRALRPQGARAVPATRAEAAPAK